MTYNRPDGLDKPTTLGLLVQSWTYELQNTKCPPLEPYDVVVLLEKNILKTFDFELTLLGFTIKLMWCHDKRSNYL